MKNIKAKGPFILGGATMSIVGPCKGCGTKMGWGLILAPRQSGGMAMAICNDCAKGLLGDLINIYLEVRKGGIVHMITPTPIEVEQEAGA